MEKRVLIAILLSIAVMYGYSMIFPQPKKQLAQVQQQSTPATQVTTSPASPQPPVASVPLQQPSSKDISIESDVYSALINTGTGSLKKLVLKKFKDVPGVKGKEIVLVNETDPVNYSLTSDFPGFLSGQSVSYTPSADSLSILGNDRKSLVLTAAAPNGLIVKKTYTFSGNSYGIVLDHSVSNTSGAPLEGNVQVLLKNRSIKPKEENGRFEVFGPVTRTDAGTAFDSITDIAKAAKTYDKAAKWSGFGDKYFLNAVQSRDNSIASITLKDANGILEQRFSSAKSLLNPGQTLNLSHNLYFGPKDIDILKAQGEHLEEAIDLGWFSAIAKPLLQSLKLFYRYLHNYGLAIIVITVILKILFFPLTHKSYKSMKEMQKLQPKMQQLKDKFKDDRDGLNKAVMELYKTHKVNPLGGCLPMLVQIPVFFGLYKALMFSIELRQAPFYFWLQDLSAKDPYYITPVIMGVTMFIQQKMTPTNMDPIQAKMMLALPVVFTFMFLNFPSGLVLYWLVNNILTIAQQAYINKSLKEA